MLHPIRLPQPLPPPSAITHTRYYTHPWPSLPLLPPHPMGLMGRSRSHFPRLRGEMGAVVRERARISWAIRPGGRCLGHDPQ